MAIIHKYLFNFVTYKDNANSSEFLISNVYWLSDELMGGRKYNGCIISYKNCAFSMENPSYI